LVCKSIKAGILCDGYSGSKVDIVSVTAERTEVTKEFEVVCTKGEKNTYPIKKGSSIYHKEKIQKINFDVVEEAVMEE